MSNYDNEDWGVLGWGWSNPVPGDADEVSALAKRFKERSEHFGDLAKTLVRIQDPATGLQGKFIESFNEKIGKLPGDIEDFSNSFGVVADKISSWETHMRTCQSEAISGLRKAQEAKTRMESASFKVSSQKSVVASARRAVSDLPQEATDSEIRSAERARDAARDLLSQYEAQLSSAREDFNDGKKIVNQAERDYLEAGSRIGREIRDVDYKPRSCVGFERFYYGDGWQFALAVVKLTSTVLTIVSLALPTGWVFALVAASVAIIQAVMSWIRVQYNDESPFTALIDTAAAVVALAPLAKFFSIKEFKSAGSTRGMLNKMKDTAFGKQKYLESIEKGMDKAIKRNPGKYYNNPSMIRRDMSVFDTHSDLLKRVSKNVRLNELYKSELHRTLRKEFLWNTGINSMRNGSEKAFDNTLSRADRVGGGVSAVVKGGKIVDFGMKYHDGKKTSVDLAHFAAGYVIPGYNSTVGNVKSFMDIYTQFDKAF